jgi:A/G-specific adenine glycosylase
LLKTLHHGVTRFRITLDCYEAEFVSEGDGELPAEIKWVRAAELENLPLNTTGRKIASMVSQERRGFFKES